MVVKFVLSRKECEKIRNIHFNQISFYEKNGIPMDSTGREMDFPSIQTLREIAIEKILRAGFREVNQVSPDDANCVIRVFNKCHYPYKGNIHNLCGFMCFTKRSNAIWISNSGNSQIELNFSKCTYICQDNDVNYECDFFDTYVYVVR